MTAEPAIGKENHDEEKEHHADRKGERVVGITDKEEACEEGEETGDEDKRTPAPSLAVDA